MNIGLDFLGSLPFGSEGLDFDGSDFGGESSTRATRPNLMAQCDEASRK
jgi:hypothetical protein